MREPSPISSMISKNGTLPAVSYRQTRRPPWTAIRHHRNSACFEAFSKNIIELAKSNKKQWESTAIFVTGGRGVVDIMTPASSNRSIFFGHRAAVFPMIAVSAFSTGRSHHPTSYGEHSLLCEIRRAELVSSASSTNASRDNLPNPRADDDNPYVSRQTCRQSGDPVRHVSISAEITIGTATGIPGSRSRRIKPNEIGPACLLPGGSSF